MVNHIKFVNFLVVMIINVSLLQMAKIIINSRLFNLLFIFHKTQNENRFNKNSKLYSKVLK